MNWIGHSNGWMVGLVSELIGALIESVENFLVVVVGSMSVYFLLSLIFGAGFQALFGMAPHKPVLRFLQMSIKVKLTKTVTFNGAVQCH